MQIDINAQSYTEEQAVELLNFLYSSYHGREVDFLGKETFLPIIRSQGYRGFVYVSHLILQSDETTQRVRSAMVELWKQELGREPADSDVKIFEPYFRFLGESGKEELISRVHKVKENLHKAEELTNSGDPASAEQLLRTTLESQTEPIPWQLYHELGRSLHHQKKYEEAVEPYKNAIMYNSFDNDWVWSCDDLKWTIHNCASPQKIKEGIKTFQEITLKYPLRWPAWHQLGWFYIESKNYEDAIECYHKAIDLAGNINSWPWSATDLMTCYSSLDRNDEGQDYFQGITGKYPNNWGVWHALGWINFTKRDDPKEAIKNYDMATAKHPNGGWVWSWFDKGLCYRKLSKFEEANRCFQKALEDDSNCWQAYNEMAWSALSHKKWDSVLTVIKDGLQVKPNAGVLWLAAGDYFRDNPKPNLLFAYIAYRHAGKYEKEYAQKTEGLQEKYPKALRKLMEDKLSFENDIRPLCFDLRIKIDNVAGDTLSSKVVSIIEICEQKNKIDTLIDWLVENRGELFPEILSMNSKDV